MEVPGFRIESTLGSGAMGTVYLAVQTDLDRQVALKVLSAEDVNQTEIRRFQREAQVMAGMRHPGIVRLYSYTHDAHQPYLVMEYLPGGTLRERLKRHPGGLEIVDVLRIGRDVLGALAELHAQNVAHRDVKPANILYRATGEAVLGDLGLVSVSPTVATALTKPQVALGTLAYMPPETLTTGEMGPGGDLYATGVVLFEALTGTHPTGFKAAIEGTRIADPVLLRRDAPRELCDLILALAEMDPEKRVQSASAALKLLSRTVASWSGKYPRRPRAQTTGGHRTVRRRSAVRYMLAGLATLLVAAGAFAITRRAPPPALEVHAGARAVTVVTHPAVPDRILCVYDGGAPVASVQGVVSGGSSTFQVAGLWPHQEYRAQLLATGDAAHAPIELTFRTRAEVELLGMDPADPRGGLWLRAAPPAQVRWTGERDWTAVSGEPVRLAGRPRDLEVQVGTSAPAVVAVTSPRVPDDVPLDLGLMVGPDPAHEQIQTPSGTFPLMDWLIDNRIAWVVLPPDKDGKPRIGQDFRAYRGAPRRMLSMRVPPAEERDARMKEVKDAKPPDGPLSLAVDPEWLYSAGLDGEGDEAFAGEIRAWRERLGREAPGSTLVVPAPLGLLNLQFKTTVSAWLRALGTLDAMSLESLADSANWEADRAKLYRGLEKIKVKPELKFIWIMVSLRVEYLAVATNPAEPKTADSIGLARCFAFARAAYPDAMVIANLVEVAGPDSPRRLAPTWSRLIGVARPLRGARFRKYLGGAGTEAPRVESRVPIAAMAFADAAHGVQVLCAEARSVRVRFTPARPGLLREPGPSQEPWKSRLVANVKPLDLEVTSTPLVYEELIRCEASARNAGAVPFDLITR